MNATPDFNESLVVAFTYCLIDPRDGAIRYVGVTKDLRHRLANHWYARRHPEGQENVRYGAWIGELGELGVKPKMIVLDAVPYDSWRFDVEAWWTRQLRDQGHDLLNIAAGQAHSAESRRRMSEFARQRRHTEATRAKISAALSGRKRGPLTEEHKAKISAASRGLTRGKAHSPAHRRKIAEGLQRYWAQRRAERETASR